MDKIKFKKYIIYFAIIISALLPLSGSCIFYSEFEKTTDSGIEALQFNNLDTQDSAEEATELIPLGSVFGIKLYTDGVIVTSLANINTDNGTFCPAADAGIKPGDYILEANGVKIENNNHLSSIISENGEKKLKLKILRNDETFETNLTPVVYGTYLRAGMWIRDSAAGIGTLTYYNPKTGKFAGLGHGICDIDTKTIVSVKDGEPAEITITSVTKGQQNDPGKLNGYFSGTSSIGYLTGNSETGIYGRLSDTPTGQAYTVAQNSEITTGDAQILATTDMEGPKLYSIKIEQIKQNTTEHTKNMVISVTDPELLQKTGGIVRGMSGCPILQNGKIIGTVTHVFVDNPTMGYGIFISNMLGGEK